MNRPFSMFAIALLFSSFGCLGTPPGGEEVDQGGTLDAERPREDAGGRLSDVADDDNATDAEPSVTPPELPQDYVRSSRFERLRLVIDHADGITPRRAATDHVVGELGAALDKPGGVDVELRDVVETAGSGHVWTFEELTALADERFGPGYSKEAIEIGVLYLDGTYEDDTDDSRVLGVAWANRYIVMFADSLDEACGTSLLPGICDAAEASVLLHEVGHVIGLVDNGAKMTADHKDPTHGKHDVSDDCVMYWAYTNSSIIETLVARIGTGDATGAALTFDDACLADLAALQ